jgi:hypothetical protein
MPSDSYRKRTPSSTTSEARYLRLLVIKKLGGRCCRCGYEDYRALQVDHVKGDGRTKMVNLGARGSDPHYLHKVLKDTSGEFQLLCSNCNQIKRYEFSEGCRSDLNAIYLKAMERDLEIDVSFC